MHLGFSRVRVSGGVRVGLDFAFMLLRSSHDLEAETGSQTPLGVRRRVRVRVSG